MIANVHSIPAPTALPLDACEICGASGSEPCRLELHPATAAGFAAYEGRLRRADARIRASADEAVRTFACAEALP